MTRHRQFVVEGTSAGGCGEQKTIVPASGDPLDAIIEAIRYHFSYRRALIEPYDEENDPNNYYAGWSRIVISIDGQWGEDGKWVGEADPESGPMEQLAQVGKEVGNG